jgi:organic hydroperoxide reductase OsmC/OhrA
VSSIVERPAVRPKEFHFPLSIRWLGGRRIEAVVDDKQPVEVAPPPVFDGSDPTTWSPEDFLVAASASCFAITFTGLAARKGAAYSALSVEADGVAGLRDDGLFGFRRIFLRVTIEGDDVEELRLLAERAEENCLVSASLDLPVEIGIDVRRAE